MLTYADVCRRSTGRVRKALCARVRKKEHVRIHDAMRVDGEAYVTPLKAAYPSSLRPRTLLAEGLMH